MATPILVKDLIALLKTMEPLAKVTVEETVIELEECDHCDTCCCPPETYETIRKVPIRSVDYNGMFEIVIR